MSKFSMLIITRRRRRCSLQSLSLVATLYYGGTKFAARVTPLPGTYHQRGCRPVRQPKISGRTSRQCNIMEIITQSGTISATNGLQGHQGMTGISGQAWLSTEFNWQRKMAKSMAWSGSTPQAFGWATDPSTLLLQIFAKVEDDSSPISGHKHKAREYICMHSARIATHHK